MSVSAAPTALVSSTTVSTTDDYTSYTPYFASSICPSITAIYIGDDTYLVFLNSVYSLASHSSTPSTLSLQSQDQELYNFCYLALNSAIYTYNKRQASSTSSPTSSPTPRPTYPTDELSCKRQGSIGRHELQLPEHQPHVSGPTPYSDPQPQSATALADQQGVSLLYMSLLRLRARPSSMLRTAWRDRRPPLVPNLK